MRLTHHGYREITVITILCAGAAVALSFLGFSYLAVVPVLLLIFALQFFRDPEREPVNAEGTIISPADGRVTDATRLKENEYLKQEATRIGIFMNVFSVHVNRSPVTGVVEYVKHHPGKFLDARNPRSFTDNEHTTIGIRCSDPFEGRVTVRLVAGMIARRIVCDLQEGSKVTKGERIGMIKFGSRVEVFLPDKPDFNLVADVGEDVYAGRDALVKYDA